jgi:hypothetical protein
VEFALNDMHKPSMVFKFNKKKREDENSHHNISMPKISDAKKTDNKIQYGQKERSGQVQKPRFFKPREHEK